jgi:hypothetical protein
MTMSDTLIVISLIAGFGTALTAAGLLFHALMPSWVKRAEQRARTAPAKSVALGVILGLVLFAAAVALVQHPHAAVKMAGVGLLFTELVFAFAGMAGVARFLGSRLPSPADAERPWKAVIRGWVVLYLASLLPVLGWFVFLPVALLTGFGAALLGLAAPKAPARIAAPSEIRQEVAA